MRRLAAMAIILFSCTTSPKTPTYEHETPATGIVEKAASSTLYFTSMDDVNIITVVSELERSFFKANKKPLNVLLELKEGYTTKGKYNLSSWYSSLKSFASSLESQDTKYDWAVTTQGMRTYLIIKPSSDAYLDETVNGFQYTSLTTCALVNKLNNKADSKTEDTGGCKVQTMPKFIPAQDAADLADQKLSPNLTGTQSVENVALEIMKSLDQPMSFTLYREHSSMQYVWEISW